jgi:transcriptional regulator with XRE-family HTH domain
VRDVSRMKLRIARIESGLSQKELSLKVGVSQQTIAKWERGVTTPSQFSQIKQVAKELDAKPACIFPDVFRYKEPVAK